MPYQGDLSVTLADATIVASGTTPANKYGGLIIPAPLEPTPGSFPLEGVVADPLIGYLANFLKTIITTYVGASWTSVSPSTPIIKMAYANDPPSIFNESNLPALYVTRAPRETREMVEKFEQTADDYRFQKSRVDVWWVLNPVQQANDRRRNSILDAVRKIVDDKINIGRDIAWIVPGDSDPKAATFGSSLLNYTGAGSIELEHAAPAVYNHKMALPAPIKHYDALKLSFAVDELLVRDIALVGEADVEVELQMKSPDQGTGLGPFDLGDGIYE